MPNRREFLAVLAGAAAGSAAGIDPIRRPSKGRFKLGLAAYSLRDHFTGKVAPAFTLPQFLDYAAELGAEGIEPTSYYFPPNFDDGFLRQLKRQGQRLGVDFSAGAIANDFCQKPGPKLEADRARVALWCRHYETLGVRNMRVFAGTVPKGDAEDAAIARCIEELDRAGEVAGRHGVMLALENHGGITELPDPMLKILRGVRSPWVAVNLDTGNFRRGPDPYADLAKIAPYAVNVQVKVDMYRNGTAHEAADYGKVGAMLRSASYAGWVSLEYEGKLEVLSALPAIWPGFRQGLENPTSDLCGTTALISQFSSFSPICPAIKVLVNCFHHRMAR